MCVPNRLWSSLLILWHRPSQSERGHEHHAHSFSFRFFMSAFTGDAGAAANPTIGLSFLALGLRISRLLRFCDLAMACSLSFMGWQKFRIDPAKPDRFLSDCAFNDRDFPSLAHLARSASKLRALVIMARQAASARRARSRTLGRVVTRASSAAASACAM